MKERSLMVWLINQGVAVAVLMFVGWAYWQQTQQLIVVMQGNTVALTEVSRSIERLERRIESLEVRVRVDR